MTALEEAQRHVDQNTDNTNTASGPGQRVEFTGTGREFFGIWIVNVLLSIVTLGIYSAWATVRTRKYIAGHTLIDGHAMQYHASGKQLLIGRLIAIAVIGLLVLSGSLVDVAPAFGVIYVILVIALFFALPWIINRSYAFHNRMTSWRNVRFNWAGTYGKAFQVFYLWPLIGIIPFLVPYAWRAQQQFLANNAGFGTRRFSLDTNIGPYYRVFWWMFLVGVLAYVLAIAALVPVFMGLDTSSLDALETGQGLDGLISTFIVIYAVVLLTIGVAAAVFFNKIRRLSIKNLKLPTLAHFDNDASTWRFIWIVVSNAVLVVITLGLFTPWAMMRTERFLRTTVVVHITGDVDTVVDHEADAGGAFGAEYAGIEGIDVGI